MEVGGTEPREMTRRPDGIATNASLSSFLLGACSPGHTTRDFVGSKGGHLAGPSEGAVLGTDEGDVDAVGVLLQEPPQRR